MKKSDMLLIAGFLFVIASGFIFIDKYDRWEAAQHEQVFYPEPTPHIRGIFDTTVDTTGFGEMARRANEIDRIILGGKMRERDLELDKEKQLIEHRVRMEGQYGVYRRKDKE